MLPAFKKGTPIRRGRPAIPRAFGQSGERASRFRQDAERCAAAGILEDERSFRSKAQLAQLALESICHQRALGVSFDVVGMADYQTRGWQAWQYHRAMVMLAMLFLTHEKMQAPVIETQEGKISITTGDITFLLERLLPQRCQIKVFDAQAGRMLEVRIGKRIKDQVRRR
jgi:hypothetical protein